MKFSEIQAQIPKQSLRSTPQGYGTLRALCTCDKPLDEELLRHVAPHVHAAHPREVAVVLLTHETPHTTDHIYYTTVNRTHLQTHTESYICKYLFNICLLYYLSTVVRWQKLLAAPAVAASSLRRAWAL